MLGCLGVLLAPALAAEEIGAKPALPPETTEEYRDSQDQKHVFLLQAPEIKALAEDAAILIYMHGAGGKEEQGMDKLPRLREVMSRWGWVYVCPRDSDFDGLRAELLRRYA